jgi:hypothetical protein
MIKKTYLGIGVFLGVIFILLIIAFSGDTVQGVEVTMYKGAACGCCTGHATYLDDEGYSVTKVELQDLTEVKEKYNIPYKMQSCHTTVIGEYFVEGHMPQEAITKLLEEKPDIKGISLPRMPAGSPGMLGEKNGPFVIYALHNDGMWQKFMRI